MNALPLLSLVVFAPWAGALLLALLPNVRPALVRGLALTFSLSTLVISVLILRDFDPRITNYQFLEEHIWIKALNAHYRLGLDGFSLMLVLLTSVVGPAGLMASWRQSDGFRLFALLYLLLQGAALGVFLALDFFHWFLFWELSLVPAFFLIKLWGGAGASRAAYQFVIYTIGGSAFMLLGFAAIFVATGTLDFTTLAQLGSDGALVEKLAALGDFWPKTVFAAVFLGLAVKVPLFPFHTWLPATYAEAPTGASMFLTAVMSKMGVYGFIRLLWPLFPGLLHNSSTLLIWLALGGVVLGALAALRQTDLKRMIAYSSINHVSYCLLALFAVALGAVDGVATRQATAAALSGAVLQTFNHGLSAAALFFCIGVLESRSGGSRGLMDFGGIRSTAPRFAGLCGIAMFSSLGLPGLNGFVGEFLIFRGVWGFTPWACGVACVGLFATALFLLTFWQHVFHGPVRPIQGTQAPFRDVAGVELIVLIPFAILMVVFGVMPQLLTALFNPLIISWAGPLASP